MDYREEQKLKAVTRELFRCYNEAKSLVGDNVDKIVEIGRMDRSVVLMIAKNERYYKDIYK